ncbi:hypothetical protein PENTCL1PPCAC_9806, partial [Pristionchus entomophagus]
QEFSLFLISFCIFMAQVLNLSIVIFVLTENNVPIDSNSYLVRHLIAFTSDMFSIGPAFYTRLLPGPIRRWVVQKIRSCIYRCALRDMNSTKVIQLLYGIPGILTYFLVIYSMRRVRRILNKSFIIIYSMLQLQNIATWLNSWVALRLRN